LSETKHEEKKVVIDQSSEKLDQATGTIEILKKQLEEVMKNAKVQEEEL
jgi:hypothetical protein